MSASNQEVAASEDHAIATAAPTPLDMLNRALDKGIDAEQLDKFIDLHHKWEANEARKAFVLAMSKFRAEPILIRKNKQVAFGTTSYKHATLDQVIAAALPHMSENGLSHRWETKQEGDQISVACVITHEQGHSERTELTAPPDESGGKNSIQAIGSTVSYLERYTFMAATGLAASDMDNDGGLLGEVISEKQAADLEALITEVGANKDSFLKTCKTDKLESLPAKMFKGAVARLEQKRKQ